MNTCLGCYEAPHPGWVSFEVCSDECFVIVTQIILNSLKKGGSAIVNKKKRGGPTQDRQVQ